MAYKKGKYKCQKCGTDVHGKRTVFCMRCRAIEKTGKTRISKEIQERNRKKYKQEYFQKNKEKIYKKRNSKPKTEKNFNIVRNSILKSRYNITLEEVNNFYLVQKGCCMICNSPFFGKDKVRMVVDHNHKTNKFRSLLCHNCNVGLGNFKEDIELLKKVIKYLENEKASNN
jgi:hypothetical protein